MTAQQAESVIALEEDQRIVRSLSLNGTNYYTAQRVGSCNCPECDKSEHWMFVAGSPSIGDVLGSVPKIAATYSQGEEDQR